MGLEVSGLKVLVWLQICEPSSPQPPCNGLNRGDVALYKGLSRRHVPYEWLLDSCRIADYANLVLHAMMVEILHDP